jgi:Fe-S cluster biogenesis protein NfuA/nitrite reductase/ring-hydroxylating ferredoxin subunit
MATDTTGGVPFEAERHLARVQELTAAIDAVQDVRAKETAEELVAAIVELYGEGLGRIIGALGAAGAAGQEIYEGLVEDGVVASLMLIHDLYPVDLETRVREALATVRPYMESHGGDVELLGLEEGVARLRLVGHCKGCAASAATLELAIKEAIEEAAPDLVGLEVEGVTAAPSRAPAADNGLLQLTVIDNGAPPPPTPTWMPLDSAGEVEPGGLRTVSLHGVELVVANVDGTLLVYRSVCADCGAGLSDATLTGPVLACAHCAGAFDLPRAGRSLTGEEAQLEPVPLLRRAGAEVKVALAR